MLSLENMTCPSCARHVRKALAAIDGVTVVDVTSEPPRAVVDYDPTEVQIEDLIGATTDVGYPSAPIGDRRPL